VHLNKLEKKNKNILLENVHLTHKIVDFNAKLIILGFLTIARQIIKLVLTF
jgi:hypothetical protein